MIRLEKIEYQAGDFRASFDADIPRGCFLGILGPSGGGKTTLLSMLAGFAKPASGRIFMDGADVTEAVPAARPVTMLFQEHNLFAHLTAFENAGLGLSPALQLSAEQAALVEAALARVGLSGKSANRPAALSGGERQRVALARALLRNRPVLLLDEPFSGLGPKLRREMLQLVVDLQCERQLTVILVSHEPDDIRMAATHAAFIAEGRMSAIAAKDRFFDDPRLADYL
ncbi:MAG: ATP-binding cassette domain-containing protein [Aestuariivirgaceae bacterium]|nr:ATP-binding cassette domain-containing protein [Aestuariivirgaceae bacterium]